MKNPSVLYYWTHTLSVNRVSRTRIALYYNVLCMYVRPRWRRQSYAICLRSCGINSASALSTSTVVRVLPNRRHLSASCLVCLNNICVLLTTTTITITITIIIIILTVMITVVIVIIIFIYCNLKTDLLSVFTARCTTVHSAVLRSLGVCLSVCDVGPLWSHRLEILETDCTDN